MGFPSPSADKAALPPGYHLDYFCALLRDVAGRHGGLLNAAEQSYIAGLEALGAPARALYARLVNRRGPCFRLERIAYPEIDNVFSAAEELRAAGFLLRIETLCVEALACFSHPELKTALRGHGMPPHRLRAELLDWLAGWDMAAGWSQRFLAQNVVVRVQGGEKWDFLKFLYFGERRDNLADFVTRALGHVVTEFFDPDALVPAFASRAAADDAYRMECLYQRFRELREVLPAIEIFSWWRAQKIERDARLGGSEKWVDRLVDRLGRLLEREDQTAAALALYATSPVAPARERRARLLLKMERKQEAEALLQEMDASPCSAEEAYAARQLLARSRKTAPRSEARTRQQGGEHLILDYTDGAVEAAVLRHYRAQGWQGVHSENWLWNAAFGLLLWDIIFDPASGAFHSPLQFSPSDLFLPEFFIRRAEKIEARLALLHDPEAALALVRKHHDAKRGIANPFVHWHEALPELMRVFLRLPPPDGLATALRHLAQNVKSHARGLPDLFLWRGGAYRFVEIKAENDHLSGHQYEWLKILAAAGLEVGLINIKKKPLFEKGGAKTF